MPTYRARITSQETTWHGTYRDARQWIASHGVMVTENITDSYWSGELRDSNGLLPIGSWSISKFGR